MEDIFAGVWVCNLIKASHDQSLSFLVQSVHFTVELSVSVSYLAVGDLVLVEEGDAVEQMVVPRRAMSKLTRSTAIETTAKPIRKTTCAI